MTVMAQRSAIPPLAQCHDGTVYLVLDDFGELGRGYRETDAAQAGAKTVIADLLSDQSRHSLRVVAFNTAEGWARDVSADIGARGSHSCARIRAGIASCGARLRQAGVCVRVRPSLRQCDAVLRRHPRRQLRRRDASEAPPVHMPVLAIRPRVMDSRSHERTG